jgi:hypothetical protein
MPCRLGGSQMREIVLLVEIVKAPELASCLLYF